MCSGTGEKPFETPAESQSSSRNAIFAQPQTRGNASGVFIYSSGEEPMSSLLTCRDQAFCVSNGVKDFPYEICVAMAKRELRDLWRPLRRLMQHWQCQLQDVEVRGLERVRAALAAGQGCSSRPTISPTPIPFC
jgi:hypothetical protein